MALEADNPVAGNAQHIGNFLAAKACGIDYPAGLKLAVGRVKDIMAVGFPSSPVSLEIPVTSRSK